MILTIYSEKLPRDINIKVKAAYSSKRPLFALMEIGEFLSHFEIDPLELTEEYENYELKILTELDLL